MTDLTERGMQTKACAKSKRGEQHRPHVHRSAITCRFLWCPGGPPLRWEGDDG